MTKHDELLANARECVDRDIERAGWRGVMAYVGTALVACAKQSERHDAALVMGSAMGYMAEFAGCGKSNTCHHTNQCFTCPHAKWPDSPSTPQTDPEPHNPAPETQKLRDGEAGAVEVALLRDQVSDLSAKHLDKYVRWQKSEKRCGELQAEIDRLRRLLGSAGKVSSRRDKLRVKLDMAEAAIQKLKKELNRHA